MMTELTGLPVGVVGVEASGKLETADYQQVMLPLIHRAAASGEVRLVLVIRDFEGVSGGGMWEDTKLGVGNMGIWKRTAVVTDIGWIATMLEVFGWLTPGEVRHFPLDQRDAAIAWAASGEFETAP